MWILGLKGLSTRRIKVLLLLLLSCSYSDSGILEKRKETKIFIERFFSHQNPVTNTFRNIKPQEIITQ